MIAKHPFGNTAHKSTRTLFGAAAINAGFDRQEAARLLEVLLRFDVNHIDTAASYGNGNSEKQIGPWMAEHRNHFFLVTKTGDRSYGKAWESIQTSVKKLAVDCLDLIQLHNLTDTAEWDTAMGPGGALEAAVEARRQGLVRFIGVTGHGLISPRMHLKSLERFPFDSVLLPWNFLLWKNERYREDFYRLYRKTIRPQDEIVSIMGIAYFHASTLPEPERYFSDTFSSMRDMGLNTLWSLDSSLTITDEPLWDVLERAPSREALNLLSAGQHVDFSHRWFEIPADLLLPSP